MSKFGCGIFVKTFFTIKNLTKKVESIFQNGEKHYSNIFKKNIFLGISSEVKLLVQDIAQSGIGKNHDLFSSL